MAVAVGLSLAVQGVSVELVDAQSSQAQLPAGGSAVTGVVVDAQDQRPIAGALVTLEERTPGQLRRTFVQFSTTKGRFAFVNVAPGEHYTISVSKAGYLESGYGQSGPEGSAVPLVVRDGQWLRDLRVALGRLGSISGTVLDERGEPVIGTYVRALSEVVVTGSRQWLAGTVAQTDDRGVYRLAGLRPGKYVVAVPSVQATLPSAATISTPTAFAGTSMADVNTASSAGRSEIRVIDRGDGQQSVISTYPTPAPTNEARRQVYAATFYPNVSALRDALPIQLRSQEDRGSIDLQLRPVKAFRVSGALQGPPEAISNVLLRLIPVGMEELGQGSETATTLSLADGRFSLLDVPEGQYVLEVKHSLMDLSFTSAEGSSTTLPAPIPFPARSASNYEVKAAPPGVQYTAMSDGLKPGYWAEDRVEVGDRDLSGVELTLRHTGTLTGQLKWNAASPLSSRAVIVELEPADGRRSLGVLTTPVLLRENPATFAVGGLLSGEYLLRVRPPGGLTTVESIVWEGRDYSDRAFDASDGKDIRGVLVTLTEASSSVRGVVSDGPVAVSEAAAVIAFPTDPERWTKYGLNPSRIASTVTSADGRYRIDGLPIGEYWVVAVPRAEERAWLDPTFFASHVSRSTRARIDRSDAIISDLMLTLIK